MSCPLVSGAAAVLREYLRVNRSWSNPPACLIKAMLLNGATENAPGQYGTGATQEMGIAPNNVEGWGRLNIENAFYRDANYRMFLWTNAFGAAGQFTTNVTVYDSSNPLKVHLTWTDFPASTLTYNQKGGGLMNDLDLRVVDPSNRTNYPRAMNTSACITYHTNDQNITMVTSPLIWEANRFTAPQLPMTLTRLDHLIYATGAGQIATFIWSESGGLPGTVLYAITNSVSAGFLLYTFSMSVALPTTNFFVGSRLISGAAYSARDAGSGSTRTFFNTGAGWFAQSLGEMWMHAYGNVSTGDHANTVEGVVISTPTGGTYKIIVSGNNLPYAPVRFAVAYSGSLVPEPALALGLGFVLALLRRRRR